MADTNKQQQEVELFKSLMINGVDQNKAREIILRAREQQKDLAPAIQRLQQQRVEPRIEAREDIEPVIPIEPVEPEVVEKPGLIQRIGEGIAKKDVEMEETFESFLKGEITAAEQAIRAAGLVGSQLAGAVGEIGIESVKALGKAASALTPDVIEKPTVEAAKKAGRAIIDSSVGQAGIKAFQEGVEAFAEFEKTNPRTAGVINAFFRIGEAVPAAKGVQLAGKGAFKLGDKIIIEPIQKAAEKGAVKLTAGGLGLKPNQIDRIKRLGVTPEEFILEKGITGSQEAIQKKAGQIADEAFKKLNTEVKKVKGNFVNDSSNQILEAVAKNLEGIPGLEADLSDIAKLLDKSKKGLTLSEHLEVKRLADKFLDLYKVTGEPKIALQKQGLVKLRSDLRGFIDDVGTERGLPGIKKLSQDIAAGRSIQKGLESVLSTAGKQDLISLKDLVIFGGATGGIGAVGGTLAVLGRKLLGSSITKTNVGKLLKKLGPKQQDKLESIFKRATREKRINEAQKKAIQEAVEEAPPVKKKPEIKGSALEGIGKSVFRGGFDIDTAKITDSGISFSTAKNVAEDFAKVKGGKVREFIVSKDAKIVDYDDVPGVEFKDLDSHTFADKVQKTPAFENIAEKEFVKAVKWARDNGFDAVKLPVEGEIRVINKNIIKAKAE